MKNCRVLSITETTMEATNQKVAQVELVEVRMLDAQLSNGEQPYTFRRAEGEYFIFDYFSRFTKKIFEAAHNEDLVQIRPSDFRLINEIIEGEYRIVHFHKSVKILGLGNSQESDENLAFLYKSQEMNGSQLAMLTTGLLRGLFPRPKTGELLVKPLKDEGCKLYFKKGYYFEIVDKLRDYYLDGSFQKSNAYNDWLDLKSIIETAQSEMNPDLTDLKDHFLSAES